MQGNSRHGWKAGFCSQLPLPQPPELSAITTQPKCLLLKQAAVTQGASQMMLSGRCHMSSVQACE